MAYDDVSLDRAVANTRNRVSMSDASNLSENPDVAGTMAGNNSAYKGFDFAQAPPSHSIIDNATGAIMGLPAHVARAVTSLFSAPPQVQEQNAPGARTFEDNTPQYTPQAPAVTPQVASSGVIPSSFSGQAIKAAQPDPTDQYTRVEAPNLPPAAKLPTIDFNVGYGQNAGGGVFGAMARGVNDVSKFAQANIARKVGSKGFSDSVNASTANAKNYSDLYDSKTKRLGVDTTADIARAKNTVDLIKAGKEVQEAQLIGTHRALLAEYAKNPSPELADMIALVKGHVLPDHIINFPESVINQSPPSAVSARKGTAITPNKGGGGFTVQAVSGAQTPQPTDKVYTNAQGQRVRIVNGQQVAF